MKRRDNRFLRFLVLLLSLGLLFPSSLFAETGHYLPGLAGLGSAVTPPRGFYYTNVTVSYNFGQINDVNGKPDNFPGVINILSNVSVFTYITNAKILGARYGLQLSIPVSNRAWFLDEEALSEISRVGLGDIYVQPVNLGWVGKKNQVTVRYGFYAPVGRYTPNGTENTGKGFWTNMFTVGDTYMFGQNKEWNASGIFRFETHSKKRGVDLTAGDDIVLEWGMGRKLGSKFVLGVTGASTWQVTKETGSQAEPFKYSAHAVGGELQYAIPQARLSLRLRSNVDVAAYDRSQGYLITFAIVWRPWK